MVPREPAGWDDCLTFPGIDSLLSRSLISSGNCQRSSELIRFCVVSVDSMKRERSLADWRGRTSQHSGICSKCCVCVCVGGGWLFLFPMVGFTY